MMECPNCHQEVETGAYYCGNCGQPLTSTYTAPGTNMAQTYALAIPAQQKGEALATLAVLSGMAGLVGAAFIPIVGLSLGLMGIVLGTMSHGGVKRQLSIAGTVISSLALIAGLASWTYAINRDSKLRTSQASAANGPVVQTAFLATPCYTFQFSDKLNVANNSGSCDVQAFNGASLAESTEVYKVYAQQSPSATPGTFNSLAKSAIEKDVSTNLPGFTILSETPGSFAASPDYIVIAHNSSQNVTVEEGAVLHQVSTGDNVFILVHAVTGSSVNFSNLENQWQWK